MTIVDPLVRLEQQLLDVDDVYVGAAWDGEKYIAGLIDSIRQHRCRPFEISAEAVSPGFPHMEDGAVVSGLCVAHSAGYWLVYQPQEDLFYCFWGTHVNSLSAPGIFGSPLYCWSA